MQSFMTETSNSKYYYGIGYNKAKRNWRAFKNEE